MTAPARRTAAETLAPADLVERMLELTLALTGTVRRETAFLRARAQADVAALQPEKIRIANDYAMDADAIRRRKDMIDRAPAERVSKLKSAMIELDRALAENGEALTAARSVSEGLIRMVANAMNEHAAPTLGYGRDAAPAARRPGNAGAPAALTLDARF